MTSAKEPLDTTLLVEGTSSQNTAATGSSKPIQIQSKKSRNCFTRGTHQMIHTESRNPFPFNLHLFLSPAFIQEEILHCEGGEALEQAAQRDCGCPLPGSVQGQVGWGFEQSGLVEGVPAHSRGVGTRWSLRSLPTQTILWFFDFQNWSCSVKSLLSRACITCSDQHAYVCGNIMTSTRVSWLHYSIKTGRNFRGYKGWRSSSTTNTQNQSIRAEG